MGDVDTRSVPLVGSGTSTDVSITINLVVTERGGVWRVLWDNETVGAEGFASVTDKDVGLNEHLVVRARVESLEAEILVVVIVQVLESKATGITTGTQVAPVVVVVGQVKLAEVNIAKSVAVTDERRFVVVVEVVP